MLIKMPATNPVGTPNTPALTGATPHQSPSTAPSPTAASEWAPMYHKANKVPETMAPMAPTRLNPDQYKLSNKTGKKHDAAKEKAHDTQNKMSTGRYVATQAATKATNINKILDSITRRMGVAWGASV